MEEKKFLVYTDGGARKNPGPAGVGIIIKRKAQSEKLKTVWEFSEYIGEATNNQAEYKAVIQALNYLKFEILNPKSEINSKFQIQNSKPKINFYLDSQLIVEQLNGRYKIKNEGLKPLYGRVRELIMKLGNNISFQHIPREKNKEADRLVNEAIDKHITNIK